jgi:hypothetical protein
MITLAFLKLLENEGLGTIDVDLFFQKLTLDKKGIYIADIGDPVARGARDSQSYELFARGDSDVDGYKRLLEIRKFILAESTNICELPAVPPITSEGYTNVELLKPSTLTNVGLDDNNRIIYSMTGTILFKEI